MAVAPLSFAVQSFQVVFSVSLQSFDLLVLPWILEQPQWAAEIFAPTSSKSFDGFVHLKFFWFIASICFDS